MLELHGINGNTVACNLSCGATRQRRAATWTKASMAALYIGGGGKLYSMRITLTQLYKLLFLWL